MALQKTYLAKTISGQKSGPAIARPQTMALIIKNDVCILYLRGKL